MGLMVLGETPFTAVSCSVVSNKAADLCPIRRVAQAVLGADRHWGDLPFSVGEKSGEFGDDPLLGKLEVSARGLYHYDSLNASNPCSAVGR